MCDPSTVTDDWVTKGFHIHVDGVELNVFTNHLGSFDFREVFSSTRSSDLDRAIKMARNVCLPDPAVRARWLKRLEVARIHMMGYTGKYRKKANGRMLDFKLIRIAIERWGGSHGNS